jgi:hypothetical protein
VVIFITVADAPFCAQPLESLQAAFHGALLAGLDLGTALTLAQRLIGDVGKGGAHLDLPYSGPSVMLLARVCQGRWDQAIKGCQEDRERSFQEHCRLC